MSGMLNRLTAKQAEAATEPGRHADGGNLYLSVTKNGRRSWVFMFKFAGRQRELGLGAFLPAKVERGKAYDFVSLATARATAARMREALAAGRDPATARASSCGGVPTFGEFVDSVLPDICRGYRSDNHARQWRDTLSDAYCRRLRTCRVDGISTEDVLSVLTPLLARAPETAHRVRGRIERMIDAARAKGLRTGENPARWKGHLDALLPKRQKALQQHLAAMPYDDVPALYGFLTQRADLSALALRFTILTGSRTSEVLNAIWDEFDLDNAVWTVPGHRMKSGRPHRVPLSDAALEILAGLHRVSAFVFPGRWVRAPMRRGAMYLLLRRAGYAVTVHGFRSSLRDWGGDRTHYPRETLEAAVAHIVGDAAEQAYRRGDALTKRRALMQDWAAFCTGAQGAANVTMLADHRAAG
jgi:integrase